MNRSGWRSEAMSDMKIKCPQCKTPLIVGPHSLKLDREQITEDEKDAEIERLRAENQGYRYQLRHVQSERNDILQDRNELDAEVQQLRAEVEDLKEEVAWFANRPDGQAVEIERLRTVSYEFERERDELRAEVERLSSPKELLLKPRQRPPGRT
jgi:chromosome segregation ATPase